MSEQTETMGCAAPMKDVLIDWPDGAEEYAWVRVSAAATSEQAVALATKEEPLDDDWIYECEGSRSWHRIDPDAPRGLHGNEYWFECQPTDEGAVEFWDLIVGEADA